MYVNTFYSFKGGVGRTMALANVAVHLARRGRRVLVVDFDLEAPGLDTFPALRPKGQVPGLVDYVREYLTTDQAPDVRDYVKESQAVDNVLVMSSGAMEREYAASFGGIDWGSLYEQREGYLFFEDLKAQWRAAFSPDYVLVDSRTGFSDTGGICTRQLPDAVTVLFFPNEQNLRGLVKVVGDIRLEEKTSRKKKIELHFVMSNVPDLDDEDDILTAMKERFQDELAFEDEPLVVHRYDSLSLLNQTLFSLDRPRSRLAREYSQVADRTVRGNLADPDGALEFIDIRRRRLERMEDGPLESRTELDNFMRQLERLHPENGEVLFELGRLARRREQQDAESLLTNAMAAGYRRPEAYLERATARAAAGDDGGASQDALTALASDELPGHIVMRAIRLLSAEAREAIDAAPAIMALDFDEQLYLADRLRGIGESQVSEAIMRRLVEDDGRPFEERLEVAGDVSLSYIGLGRFRDAMDMLALGQRGVDQMNIRDAFNYGMALWGESGEVDKSSFERVVSLDAMGSAGLADANYLQCLAMANWAVGHRDAAADYAARACEAALDEREIFSCWRYRNVPQEDFVADTERIKALIGGDQTQEPEFLVRAKSGIR